MGTVVCCYDEERRDLRSNQESHAQRTAIEGDSEPQQRCILQQDEDDIHVLVELPKDVVGGARDDSRLARIEQKLDHLYEKSTTEVYNLSKISSTKGRELRQQLHILLVDVKTVPFLVGTSRLVEQFEWESEKTKLGQDIKLTEERHCKPYLAYVERNIGAVLSKENLCVLGVEHQNLLHVKIPGHNIKLSGRTDLLILSDDVKKHPHRLEELPDVRMLIEVKQEMKCGASSQTISELIALDLMTASPVMALLTDLKKTWQFFWVSEKSNDSIIIHTAVIEKPGDAFEVIRTYSCSPPVLMQTFNLLALNNQSRDANSRICFIW